MKVKFFLIFCAVVIFFGCAGKPHVPPTEGIMYTAYNIWRHGSTVFAINFKVGQDIITAGTKVYDVEAKKVKMSRNDLPSYLIKFKLAETGRQMTVRFISRWHPGESIYTYKSYMFTHQNFEQLTEGLTDEEIFAIKMGAIVEGMSKRAVLISYGRPPEHVNEDLSANKWVYWENKVKRKYICFDDDERVISCGL